MIWDDVRGRADQVEMFRRTIRRGRLASAYLFLGPEGTGKNLFAQRLAHCLFCTTIADEQLDACGTCSGCRQMQAGSHPDFLRIACPEGKREIPIDLFVGSREARGREGLCHDLSIRPMASHRRIAVIDGADLMNEESANALLKTLEEPPSYALMILIAANPDSLLSTIRSRCQAVRFPALDLADVADLLIAQGMVSDPSEAAAVAWRRRRRSLRFPPAPASPVGRSRTARRRAPRRVDRAVAAIAGRAAGRPSRGFHR